MKWIPWAVTLLILASCGRATPGAPSTQETVSSDVQSGAAAARSLGCSGDGAASSSIFVADEPGSPNSPKDAIASHFSDNGISIGVSDLVLVARNADEAQYAYEDDEGHRVLSLYLRRPVDTWFVEGLSACPGVL